MTEDTIFIVEYSVHEDVEYEEEENVGDYSDVKDEYAYEVEEADEAIVSHITNEFEDNLEVETPENVENEEVKSCADGDIEIAVYLNELLIPDQKNESKYVDGIAVEYENEYTYDNE